MSRLFDTVTYKCATDGKSYEMQDVRAAFLTDSKPLHSSSWAYEIVGHSIRQVNRLAYTVDATYFASMDVDGSMRMAFDADVVNETPGTLEVNGWSMTAYVVKLQTEGRFRDRIKRKATIVLLDGSWWRKVVKQFLPGSTLVDSDGLNYAHNYEHNYNQRGGGGTVETGLLVPCKPLITFYGPVIDPNVTIAGNLYKVTGNVAEGGRVEIDGRLHTVTYITQGGATSNKFADAVRGDGEGAGSYIFQPLPPGVQSVTWNDDGYFGVDVGWYEESGEPTWPNS